jgi:Fe-S-cluster containining protein
VDEHVRVLSFHARYGCRRRGVCCEAGWDVPVEADRAAELRRAAARRAVRPRLGNVILAARVAGTPERLARPDGRCAFFDRDPPACRVHASLGHPALPLACRQFPRICLRDPRGSSVTLSHYCPTAEGLLDADERVSIETDAPAFPAGGEYVGLDATEGVPPLLRPDMAMDWEAWWTWERLSVECLTRDDVPVDASLARLRGAVQAVRSWRPEDGPLAHAIDRAFASAEPVGRSTDATASVETVRQAIPGIHRPPAPRNGRALEDLLPRARRRFVAAHAFANWTAHLGVGLRAWLRSIEAADALLRSGLTPGKADLWLRHLADPHALARAWSHDS